MNKKLMKDQADRNFKNISRIHLSIQDERLKQIQADRLTTYQTISKDWEYNPMADRFIYQHGVFTVTRDLAMQRLKEFGKDKYPNAWILDALNDLLKEWQ